MSAWLGFVVSAAQIADASAGMPLCGRRIAPQRPPQGQTLRRYGGGSSRDYCSAVSAFSSPSRAGGGKPLAPGSQRLLQYRHRLSRLISMQGARPPPDPLRPSSAFPCLHNSHARCRHPAPGRFADAHHRWSSDKSRSRAALPTPQLFRRCSKSLRVFPPPALLPGLVGQQNMSRRLLIEVAILQQRYLYLLQFRAFLSHLQQMPPFLLQYRPLVPGRSAPDGEE